MPFNPQQSQQKRRRPRSRYGTQLQEKQQLKEIFGIREGQLKRYFFSARRARGETGPRMISMLESRLDNAIFRAGFAQTRAQARQMASHRFFSVNGHAVNIPSYQLKKGDVVQVRETKKSASYFSNFDKRMQNVRPPSWISLNPAEFGFTITGVPTHEEANLGVDIRAIVEFFAR
ncbi:MAG: 30S ribosomal protein S4 [Candidatus Andersenbacteria bacterium]|nr:30S ribosomal protein S4 [Candidatus Andersenbacteria bacterium]MBI3250321.1 30S ribosomal protein S4 [Candidatus Andersenbacteria bacterium]